MDSNALMNYVDRFQEYVRKNDDIQEHLDQRGASDERLSSMLAAESKALSVSVVAPTSKISRNLAARSSLSNMVRAILQRQETRAIETWLNALCILDVYCLNQPDALERDSHLTLAVTLVMLELKSNTTSTRGKHYEDSGISMEGSLPTDVSNVVRVANKCLNEFGMPPLQWVDVPLQEKKILTSIRWRTHIPTADEWISLIRERLHALMLPLLSSRIAQICQYCSHWAMWLVSAYRTTAELSPRVVANGLFCLSCVASGVLPQDVFAPSEIDNIPDMFKRECPQLARLTTQEGMSFVAALIAATGSDFPRLQNDTDIVNDAIACLKVEYNHI